MLGEEADVLLISRQRDKAEAHSHSFKSTRLPSTMIKSMLVFINNSQVNVTDFNRIIKTPSCMVVSANCLTQNFMKSSS